MKRPRFHRARIVFRRALGLAPGLVKAGPGFLNRALADIRQKEYPVFVQPAVNQFRSRFRRGSSKAAGASPALDAMSPASSPDTVTVPAPEQDAPPTLTANQGQAAEDLLDPRLVEEIFARSTPPVAQPEEQHELGRWDAGEQVTPAAALPELTGEQNGSLSDGADTLEIGSDDPVETVSGAAVSTEITGTGATQPKPVDGPLVQTMVETFPDGTPEDNGLGDFLSGDLQDVFNTTNHTNPLTKALLKGREQVDLRELADELKEYAGSIGAVTPAPRKR